MEYQKFGFKSGLEIHQQLDTKKLFCNTSSFLRSDDPKYSVRRKLHAIAGETGEIDEAVKHEASLDREFIYQGYDSISLIELDEEPPLAINEEALEIGLHIALLLNCDILPVSQVMRKIVIDGSNTSGFQRTVLIARNGYVETKDGKVKIEDEVFPYFIMEKCDCNLKEYLESNEVDISQKILLCYEIAKTIGILHYHKIYHRDIKAENIFFIDDQPIVGDLGLVESRDSDFVIDERGEIIGPIGWMTPEATNKFLTEKTKFGKYFNCKIDKKSDIFQLGKLFWYILQGNLPLGQIIFDDFIVKDQLLYNIIFEMLQHESERRPTLTNIQKNIKYLFPNYQL